MLDWDKVETYLTQAKGIAFDTCHKIYVLMDDEQMEQMKTYEYDPLISADTMSYDEMLSTLKKWFANSCGLRFIDAVETNHDDPNAGFTTLIGQGDSEEEVCEHCGWEEDDCQCGYDDEDEDEDEDE